MSSDAPRFQDHDSPTHSTPLSSAHACTPALARLADALAKACDGPRALLPERTILALQAAAGVPGLLSPAQRAGAADTYQRHLLLADPAQRFAVVALVWRPGQASPVHGHHTWCALTALDGLLEETRFAWDQVSQRATAQATAPLAKGIATFAAAGMDGVHQLRNVSAGIAISLHVYGVGGDRVATHVNRRVTEALAQEQFA